MKDSIDKVLAGLREVETPGGLEGRVLRRLEAKAEGRRAVWGWGAAAVVGLTLVLVGTIFVGGRRGEHTPGAEAPIVGGAERPNAEALGYLQAEAGDSRAEGRGHIAGAKARILSGAKMSGLKPGRISEATAGARATAGGDQGSFPAPSAPVTGEEKMLVRIARQGSEQDREMLNPELQAMQVARVDEEFEEFLHQPKTGTKQ